MGLSQSTTSSVSSDATYSYSAGGLPGMPGGPPAVACPSQFLCTQQNAQCAALADFYCATNGWLWAQGPVQGMGWSAAAGCYASLPAFGCVAAVPPVPTDYCTFSGVSCAEDGITITALNLTAQGTTSATISVTNPVAQLSRSWGSSQYGSHYGRGWPYTGTYIPTDEFPIVTPSVDPFSCSQYGGVAEFNDVTGVFDCWQFTSVDLNASGIDGPWYCPSYLSGGSSAPYVSSTSSPGAAWNFSFGAVLYVTNPNQVPGGWVSCQVGLANNTVYTTGRETATCFGCYMYGSLPASIGNLTGLTALILNTNLLFGALPDSIGRLTNLMDLEVAGNQLTGPLPSSLGSLTSLTSLDLNNNAITGTIPDLGNLSNLTYLMLASNQLAGSFPESLCRLFSQTWTFAQGEFSPAPIGILLTNNLLSGTLPDCIGNMSGLLLLDLGYNRLTGSIPESIGNLSGYVAPQPLRLPPPTPPHWPPYPTAPSAPDAPLIDLGQTTTTDEMLLGIIGLGYLALNNNQLSGTIPSSIGSLSYLHHLDLSSNQLTGNVPDSLQWLVSGANCVLAPELSILMAFMSMTLGTAAPPWCFTSLQLDSNRLTGTIPAWLGSFGAPFGPLGPGSDGSVINLNGSPKTLSLTSNLFSGLGDPSMFMGSQFTGFVNTSSPSGSGQTATMYVGPTVTQLPGPLLYGCPPGFWRSGLDDLENGTSGFPVPVCSPCTLGFVAPETGTETCASCLANQYADGDGIHCQPCPQNAVSLPGAPSLSNCSCIYGYIPSYAPDGTFTCVQCAAGTSHNYSLTGNSNCIPCLAGTYSVAGASQCVNCPPGFFSSADNTACVPCPAGTALNASSNSCSNCATGSVAAADGAAACSPCPAGYYSDAANTRCIACPAGSFLNGSSLACSVCPAGSFTNTPAQTHCLLPPAGFVSSPQTTHASSLTMGGLSAASFGPAQNATLSGSIAATLKLAPDAIAITSVVDVSARRRLAAFQLQANFTAVTTGAANTASVLVALTTATFTQQLASALAASGDSLLSAVSAASITVSPPLASTVYLDAEPCAAGTYLDGATQSCVACAHGTVAPTSSSTTCAVCPARTVWLNASVPCLPCPNNAGTNPNDPAQCACMSGFYDVLFGASRDSPECAPCPLGGVCTTGFVAAEVDWWRENTTSDTFYKCKVERCLAENVTGPLSVDYDSNRNYSTQPVNCIPGHTGPLCSLCLDGYAFQSGVCLPCDPADAFHTWSPGSKAALVIMCTLLCLLFVAFVFFLPLTPALHAATLKSASAAHGVLDKVCSLPKRSMRCFAAKKSPTARLPPTKIMEDIDDGACAGATYSTMAGTVSTLEPDRTAGAASAARQAQSNGAATAVAGLVGSAAAEAMLSEELGDEEVKSEDAEDAVSELLHALTDITNQASKYGKIVINFFQIVSSFLRSIDVSWPPIFIDTMSKISVINLNWVRLPKAACLNPTLSYYEEFNTYTLGLLCVLIFICGFWAFGRYLLSPWTLRDLSEQERRDRLHQFSSTCLQHTLMLLYLVYPGVSVAIFGIFSCTQIGARSWLDQDFRIPCKDTTWWRYVGGAIVWVTLVPVGIPVFFNQLLRHYRVPEMAKLLEDNAWLREAAEHTWRLGMPQPAADVRKLCCDSIDNTHLAMLHAVLVQGADASQAADLLAGRALDKQAAPNAMERRATTRLIRTSRIKAALAKLTALRRAVATYLNPSLKLNHSEHASTRDVQLATLLLWCRHSGVLAIGAASWSDDFGLPDAPACGAEVPNHTGVGLRSHEVPALLKRASTECGFLFTVYSTRCWYWESIELLRKLALTSILALVSPGSAGQVVVGCLVALFALLANIKVKPFASRNLNMVNSTAQLNLFLFLFVALLLKVNLDGDNSASFYSGIVGALTILPVALPFALQAYIKLGSWNEEQEDLEGAAEEGDAADFEG